MAPCYRLDRGRIYLLIFARSLILLLCPAEALPPEQPNKRVRHAQRKCRASLQTAPGVPSPDLVHDGNACSDGAPSILCPWQNALSRPTAPQILKTPRTPKKAASKRHQGIPRGVPSQSPQGPGFSYGTTSLTACRRPKFQAKKQGPPVRIKSLQEWLDHLLDAQPSDRPSRSYAPLRTSKGERHDRPWTFGRPTREY